MERPGAICGLARALLASVVLIAAGCAARGPVLPTFLDGEEPPSTELTATPFFPQQAHQCGPAALATVLNAAGADVSPRELVDSVFIPEREGSLQHELIASARREGFLPYVIVPALDDLIAEVNSGRPVLVLQNLGVDWIPVWHYAVVIGYEAQNDRIVLRSGTTRRKLMPASRFLASWRRAGQWGLTILQPDELPAKPDHDRYLKAAAGLESTGRIRAARKAYEAALREWPQSADARLGIGNAFYAQQDTARAEETWRELLAAHPGHAVARNNLASVLAERGCHRAAMREIETGLATTRSGSALHGLLMETRREIAAGVADSDAEGC